MTPHQTIAHYRITSKLGEGGMGAVYRATDTKLGRDVAIKVLPPALANDADYLARFAREAQVLATLNHPNIAGVYGLEDNAIVMELVEGAELKGPLPLDEAVGIAKQIADGLEAAHERGIIHRDLKPANIKIAADGIVKILDFGLAKATEPTRAASASAANSPTLTIHATTAGMILGTAAYMSPEQAAGKPVDRRADIWAFGVVLWELITGRQLFQGETVSHTLASVLKDPVDFNPIPDGPCRALIARCLDRNPKTRLGWIGEARVALDQAGAEPVAVPVRQRQAWPLMAVAAVFAVAFAAVSFRYVTRERPQTPPLLAFSFTPKDFGTEAGVRRAAISPDGRHIAYVAEDKLWVRALASEQARAIEGSEGALGPFWSPDSAQIGFVSDGELKKASLAGGMPFTLGNPGSGFRGGAWSPDGRTILLSTTRRGLMEFPAAGGAARVVTRRGGSAYYSPCYLPNVGSKRRALASRGNLGMQTVELIDLESGKSETLLPRGAYPAWSDSGYILYQTDAAAAGLWALRFVPQTEKVDGEPVPLVNEGSHVSASADGTLVWQHASNAPRRLIWRNREGKKLAPIDVPVSQSIGDIALSPDGTRALYSANERSNRDIWVLELARGLRTRLTFFPGLDVDGVWSPAGTEIAFSSTRRNNQFNIFVQSADGSGEAREVVASAEVKNMRAWSPDGSTLLFRRQSAETGVDFWIVKRNSDGTFGTPSAWLQTPFNERDAVFSPDGQYVVYESDESGRSEVYVRPAGGSGGKWQISSAGGENPRWSRDGREIYYSEGDRLMAAPVNTSGGALRSGAAAELFRNHAFAEPFRRWDAHPDGKRFLIAEDEQAENRSDSIHVIQNWPALLREKAAR